MDSWLDRQRKALIRYVVARWGRRAAAGVLAIWLVVVTSLFYAGVLAAIIVFFIVAYAITLPFEEDFIKGLVLIGYLLVVTGLLSLPAMLRRLAGEVEKDAPSRKKHNDDEGDDGWSDYDPYINSR